MSCVVLIAVWAACGVGAAGITYAHFDAAFPTLRRPNRARRHRELLGMGGVIALLGPVGLLVSFFLSGFASDGWRLRLGK